jgi:hypothetical protein
MVTSKCMQLLDSGRSRHLVCDNAERNRVGITSSPYVQPFACLLNRSIKGATVSTALRRWTVLVPRDTALGLSSKRCWAA